MVRLHVTGGVMMSKFLRHSRRAAVVLILLGGFFAVPSSAGAAVSLDWTAYEHGPYHRSTSYGDSAITSSNAASLHAAWSYKAVKQTVKGQPGPSFDASPVVMNGVVYIGSRTGIFTALRASTGAVVWQRQLDYGHTSDCPAKGIISTANVQADPVTHALTVYVGGSHYLYALNAATGAVSWRRAIGPANLNGEEHWYNWSSPTIEDGQIYVGLGADCDAIKIRGGEVQVNQHTGAVTHTWYDAPSGQVGATVWSSSAADGTSVWVSTGNPAPSNTQTYDAYSVVRLDAKTFTKQDEWTGTFPLGADLDFGSSPTLFTAKIGGVSTNLVGACNKNGTFYAWRSNALAAGPLWQNQVGIDGTTMAGACITSAAFDQTGNALYVGANELTPAGKLVQGVVRQLDPAAGTARWKTDLPCGIYGSPTLNGTTHVLAVPLYGCAAPGVALLDAQTGAVLKTITSVGGEFAQPDFAEGALYVADESGTLTKYIP